MRTNFASFAMIVIAGVSGSTLAHEGDVGLKIESGRLVTGIVDASGSSEVVVPGQRVFAAEFGTLAPGYSDEPGFYAAAGEFSSGSRIGFDVLKAVRSWNGSDFGELSSSRITLEYASGAFSVTSPVADSVVPGFSFPVGASGGFDEHLDLYLVPDSTGIYLLEVQLWTTESGVSGTDPIWLVLNNGADEAMHDDAISWVEANLVPAPGVLGLMAVGAGLASRRRRN
jgi:hypothetical protein